MEKEILEKPNTTDTSKENNQEVEDDFDLIQIYTTHNEAP